MCAVLVSCVFAYECCVRMTPVQIVVPSVFMSHTHSELSVAGSSTTLAGIIARNVEKTIKLFNMKCEQAVRNMSFPLSLV